MSQIVTTAFIDGIDGDVARLIVGERVVEVPASLLPADAREGAWVRISVAGSSPPAADDTEALREKLGAGDPGGDIKL